MPVALPEELLARYRQGKSLVILAGSGISADAGIPLAGGIIKVLRAKYPDRLPVGQDLSYSEAFRQAIPEREGRRAFVERLCIGKRPTKEHLVLAQLLALSAVRCVVTTNFDHLIEHAALLVSGRRLPVYLHDDELWTQRSQPSGPMLIKIHGDFLFDDISNLSEELQDALNEVMHTALLDVTRGSDLLVVGYSGSDRTIVKLVTDLVRQRTSQETTVWWSFFSDNTVRDGTPLAELFHAARERDNPVRSLGPWPASDCLVALCTHLNVPPPTAYPFGLRGGVGIDTSLSFAPPCQPLAGATPGMRLRLVAEHPRLLEWVEAGGTVLVYQEPGAGASTVVSGLAEREPRVSLYFDTRFATVPMVADVDTHLSGLGVRLGVPRAHKAPAKYFEDLFRQSARVIIDGLEDRWGRIDPGLLSLLAMLVEAQKAAGQGCLVVVSRVPPGRHSESLRDLGDAGWLREAQRIYVVECKSPRPANSLDTIPLALSKVLFALNHPISRGLALDLAGLGWKDVVWDPVPAAVDLRRDQVVLRDAAFREFSERPSEDPASYLTLGNAVAESLERAHPLRRASLALACEEMMRQLGNSAVDALPVYLRCVGGGSKDVGLASYFGQRTLCFVKAMLERPQDWRAVSDFDAADFLVAVFRVPDAEIIEGNGKPDAVRGFVLTTLLEGRTQAADRFLRARALALLPKSRAVAEELAGKPAGEWPEEDDDGAKRFVLRIERARFFAAHVAARGGPGDSGLAAISALAVNHACIELARAGRSRCEVESGLRASLHWAEQARRYSQTTDSPLASGKCEDNAIAAVMGLGDTAEAERRLMARLDEVCQIGDFSDEKAVVLGNLHLVLLRRGAVGDAEAMFLEALLQNIYLRRYDAVAEDVRGMQGARASMVGDNVLRLPTEEQIRDWLAGLPE